MQDEYRAVMAQARRDPHHRLQEAVEALGADLDRWDGRAPIETAQDRNQLDRLYPQGRCAAEAALARVCQAQRDLELLRNAVLDQLGAWDAAYFAHDDRLAEQRTGGAA